MGQILAISPKLAPRHKLQPTQKRKPYKNATELPDGMTRPRPPARAIHVLWTAMLALILLIGGHNIL